MPPRKRPLEAPPAGKTPKFPLPAIGGGRFLRAAPFPLAVWILFPLFIASLSRPILWWDYLTSGGLFHAGPPAWSRILSNAWVHFSESAYIIRPTVCMLHDLQILLFGEEFALWYVVKWAARAGAIFLLYRILQRLGASYWERVVICTLVLFHHSVFQLMLHAPDGWLALGALAEIALLLPLRLEELFDLGKLSRARYLTWQILSALVLGVKEAAFPFHFLLVAMMTWFSPRKTWPRLAPNYVLLALWMWRLHAASGRTGGLTVQSFFHNLSAHLRILAPKSPFWILDILFLLLALFAVYQMWLNRARPIGRLYALCFAAAGGMLAIASTVELPALRYIIPVTHLLAIPAGLALARLPDVCQRALPALALVYPLVTAGQTYTQELAYQQLSYEGSEVLYHLETYSRQGMQLAFTDAPFDQPTGEWAASLRRYFQRTVPAWPVPYPPRPIVNIRTSGIPPKPFVLVSQLRPAELARTNLVRMRELQKMVVMSRGQYGILEKLTNFYNSQDARLHFQGPPTMVDMGAPRATLEPTFILYLFDPTGAPGLEAPFTLVETNLQSGESRQTTLGNGPRSFYSKPSDAWMGRTPIGTPLGCEDAQIDLKLEVEQGELRFGVMDDSGKEVRVVPMPSSTMPYVITNIPCAGFQPSRAYSLFFRAQRVDQPLRFTIREIHRKTWPVEVALPFRRYGSWGL